MINDNMPVPHCPWCGHMMRKKMLIPRSAGCGTYYGAYYRCISCGAPSPEGHGASEEEAGDRAYKAATNAFCNPGNRLLTMEEVREERLVWAVPKDSDSPFLLCWYAEDDMFDFFVVLESPFQTDDQTKPTILKQLKVPREFAGARFWLRKPTKAELDNVKWEDENER